MIYKAIDVANWFINQFDKESGDVITHLKLQKLLYFSEAWCQVLLDRELFSENMEAWSHGPVVREVFNQFKSFGWNPLDATDDVIEFDSEVKDVLLQVMETYGNVSAKALEHLTHQDIPWKEARGDLSPEVKCSNSISKQSLKSFFNEKYGDKLYG
ncbi:MAG: type II toxin-antitoxin system antitoxin SocA domain-containing protein [Pseudomonadota bacterium]